MTDKSWKLLTKLIDACGYDVTQIEDEYDFDELCEDVRNKLVHYKEALNLIEDITKDLYENVCRSCGWYDSDGCDPTNRACGELIKILRVINVTKGITRQCQ